MKKLLSFFALSLFFFSCDTAKKIPTAVGVDFVSSDNLTAVLEMAESKDKLVFVDFYTTWCLPCKMMDEDVFPDKGISKLMNDNFVSYKVNAEKGNGPNLAALYQVVAYPTLLFLDGKGNVLVRKEGSAYHSELTTLAEEAMATTTAGD